MTTKKPMSYYDMCRIVNKTDRVLRSVKTSNQIVGANKYMYLACKQLAEKGSFSSNISMINILICVWESTFDRILGKYLHEYKGVKKYLCKSDFFKQPEREQ